MIKIIIIRSFFENKKIVKENKSNSDSDSMISIIRIAIKKWNKKILKTTTSRNYIKNQFREKTTTFPHFKILKRNQNQLFIAGQVCKVPIDLQRITVWETLV